MSALRLRPGEPTVRWGMGTPVQTPGGDGEQPGAPGPPTGVSQIGIQPPGPPCSLRGPISLALQAPGWKTQAGGACAESPLCVT